MSTYAIQSLETFRFLLTDGHEKVGSRIQMVPKAENKIVVSNQNLLDGIVVSVLGEAGMYVSLVSKVPGEYLTWSNKEFLWELKIVEGNYEFRVPGGDLYWFTDKEYESNLIVQSHHSAKDNEVVFRIVA